MTSHEVRALFTEIDRMTTTPDDRDYLRVLVWSCLVTHGFDWRRIEAATDAELWRKTKAQALRLGVQVDRPRRAGVAH